MDVIWSVLALMGQVMKEMFLSPLFLIIYAILFVIVSWQYRRMEVMSAQLLNTEAQSYLLSALVSTLLGLLGGVIGSLLLIITGIDLYNIGIMHLWVIALLLMLINPRFLCFAYAGGLLALSSLLFGYPVIDIPQLMGLIAVLHMVESLLIRLNGHLNPIPVYVKKHNSIRGGFNLQKFWPLPLIALVSVGFGEPGAGITMPDWWPLLKDYSGLQGERIYTMLPVLAVLGYGEIGTTAAPRDKVRESSRYLFGFSFILLILSILAARYTELLLVAALFSPLGHELVIWLGMQRESQRQPIYTKPPAGVKILQVRPHTPAAQAGLKSGDVILKVNHIKINRNYQWESFYKWDQLPWQLQVQRGEKQMFIQMESSPGNAGLVLAPEPYTPRYLAVKEETLFDIGRRLAGRFRKK
ncbi:PDZ domain-containing protein [Syntrophomonas erecta]